MDSTGDGGVLTARESGGLTGRWGWLIQSANYGNYLQPQPLTRKVSSKNFLMTPRRLHFTRCSYRCESISPLRLPAKQDKRLRSAVSVRYSLGLMRKQFPGDYSRASLENDHPNIYQAGEKLITSEIAMTLRSTWTICACFHVREASRQTKTFSKRFSEAELYSYRVRTLIKSNQMNHLV